MNKAWMEMMGYESEEEARAEMARRGAKGKGVKKSKSWMRDNPEEAKKAREKAVKARWGSNGRGKTK